MSPIQTKVEPIQLIINCPYPNGVTYTLLARISGFSHRISCDLCRKLKIPWTYDVSEVMIATAVYNIQLHIREVLLEHANKHNDLLTKLENKYNSTAPDSIPSLDDDTVELVHHFTQQLEKLKNRIEKEEDLINNPKNFRKIELSDEK